MADKRAYFKVDVGYLMNPKVLAVAFESPTAVLLHLAAMAYSAQHLTDGVVPLAIVQRIAGATAEDAERLFKRGLLIDRHDGDVEVHDYLEHQRSAAEAKAVSDRARTKARARWDADSNAHGNAASMPGALPAAVPAAMQREREERERREGTTRARSTRLPATWTPTDEHRTRATESGVDIDREAIKFRAYNDEKGRTAQNWNAAFTRWLINAAEYAQRDGRTTPSAQPARRLQTVDELRRKREEGLA